MKTRWIALVTGIALSLLALTQTACKSSGSYEYKPGKGWVPN